MFQSDNAILRWITGRQLFPFICRYIYLLDGVYFIYLLNNGIQIRKDHKFEKVYKLNTLFQPNIP